jgi:hypothetical protein
LRSVARLFVGQKGADFRGMSLREVGSIENDVLIGRNDQLFLAGGAHSVIDYVTGKRRVSDMSYDIFQNNIGICSTLPFRGRLGMRLT